MARYLASPANPHIKDLAKLKRRRERDASGRFLIEGRREVERAHEAGVVIDEIIVATELANQETAATARRLGVQTELTEVSPKAFSRLSNRSHPDGLIAAARQFDTSLATPAIPDDALVLVVESVEKPGNLGAMVRTADALGADAVIVADPVTDVFNPNVIRASQGAVFAVPLAVAPLADVIAWVAEHGLRLVVGHPAGGIPPWEADLTGGVAITVGSEHAGVSADLAEGAEKVTIPMRGLGDSLNASVAAALLLYEVVRRRSP